MPRTSEIGATRASRIYPLRLPPDLDAQWATYCERANKKAPATLRALMRYLIQDDMPPDIHRWVASQTEGTPDDGPKKRLEVRLTPTELSSVTARAEAEGCSPQRWVINCVRASLTHEPQFTMDITKALWESSSQLRAIGRNLNQIAKQLNEGKEASITSKQIDDLSAYIYSHTNKVAASLDASLSRWNIRIERNNDDDQAPRN